MEPPLPPARSSAATQTDAGTTPAELQFFTHGGRRYVRPYHFDFQTHVKGRWVGRTLLQVFQQEFPYQPQHYFPKAIAAGRLTACSRDGRPVLPATLLRQGDAITHIVHRHEPSVLEPAVRIITDDDDVVVVVKSCSVPVHVSGRFRRNTVVHILDLVHGFPNLLNVNRLDRVTSGIVILARTKDAARRLTDQIQGDGVVRKEYLAKVAGRFPDGDVVCNAPLAIDPKTRSSFVPSSHAEGGAAAAGDDTGNEKREDSAGVKVKPASTKFRLLMTAADGSSSLVHCVPITGRTHQIRVHLQYLGHAIVDDPLYGPPDTEDSISRKRAAPFGEHVDAPAMSAARMDDEGEGAQSEAVELAAVAAAGTAEVWTDTSLDPICAHCPAIEPSSENEADAGDGVCLHAFAYSCPSWCYVCPPELVPDWAQGLKPEAFSELARLRETARAPPQ